MTATNKMYLVKDDSKLNTEAGYEPYTASSASSVPWSGVTGKPSTFAPPTAAASTLGGVKVGYTTSGKNYKLQVDASGNAFVNVPWTDNNTTYNQATADTLGLVKIGYSSSGKNYAVSLDSNGKMYVNVPWTDNNTTYAQATSDNLGLVKIGYSANGKNYPVALDGSGKMYVNVPVDGYQHHIFQYGGAKFPLLRERPVWFPPQPQVNKPLFYVVMARGLSLLILTYAKANTSTLGLVMIGYAENGKNYPVELDGSGKMYVNVPWTDTNTTYGVVGANGSTGLVKNGSTVTSASGYTACPIVSGVP